VCCVVVAQAKLQAAIAEEEAFTLKVSAAEESILQYTQVCYTLLLLIMMLLMMLLLLVLLLMLLYILLFKLLISILRLHCKCWCYHCFSVVIAIINNGVTSATAAVTT
jgi:hypothetical protein